MEANFFRFATFELEQSIVGLRIEKIFDPAPGAFTIDVGSVGYVVLYASPSRGFFFLSRSKPDNKRQPSGQVMWLRKRIRSRRILDILTDWPRRQMAWQIALEPPEYLLFDLRDGLKIVDHLEDGFGRGPVWPNIEEVRDSSRIWERFPQITPPLRYMLAKMTRERGKKLLENLETGVHAEGFWVVGKGNTSRLSLWGPEKGEGRSFERALEAAEAYGFPRISSMVNQEFEIERQRARKIKHLKKCLKRLDQDERRLRNMVEGREKGKYLQSHLYRLDRSLRMKRLSVTDVLGQENFVDMDPTMTLLENMQRFFSRAKKGERGLPIVQQRREYLERECERIARVEDVGLATKERLPTGPSSATICIPKKYRNFAVHLYRTDDQFLLVRGKNQKANHQLLSQLASPFDYWFHAQDGPGAHVILKRDFETQEIPRASMEQAAVVAALSSWQRGSDKARVLCALIRNVRKTKGAALGRVQVDQVRESIVVTMQPELEERLRILDKNTR